MAAKRITEPAFNVELGRVLRTRHPRWDDRIDVESTGVFSEKTALHPDIVVRHPDGMPVIVETEFTPASTVEQDAKGRLGMTFSEGGNRVEQVIAVRVPDELSVVSQHELGEKIQEATLAFCVFSGTREEPERWPAAGWIEASIDELADCIEQAAMSEDSIARGMKILEEGIDQAATMLRAAGAIATDTLPKIADKLHQRDGEQTSRMAMAILANALTFYLAIAGTKGIPVISELRGPMGNMSKTRTERAWWHILNNVNYWPIFQIALKILAPIGDKAANRILGRLTDVANDLVGLGATSQHDLSGRMFQRLIVDRKFLATFYTLPSSSALLAELAVARLDADWSDGDAVASLRIADFACGTGALLNAAYGAVMRRHRRTGGDDRGLHPRMIEDAIVGSDIMPAATHLTASVLSSAHPTVQFQNTSILTLPYGEQITEAKQALALGALDLIEEEWTTSLFDIGQERVVGGREGHTKMVDLPHRSFDLVIMNPPFTRPTGHEGGKIGIPVPSFAGFSTSESEQRAMSRKLGKIRKPGMAGNGRAGLASNFIDIAHAKVRDGGVVALVLPAVFLQGSGWSNARSLFAEHYQNVVVISIAATGSTDRAFSADTGMAEVLVIATRRCERTEKDAHVLFVNLASRPDSILDAVSMAREVMKIPADRDVGPLQLGSGQRAGCTIRGAWSETGCAGVREAGVAGAAAALAKGRLELPRRDGDEALPVTGLGALGKRGLSHIDVSWHRDRAPFDMAEIKAGEVPTWPTLWGHDAGKETRMIVEPDRQGVVRPGRDERATEVWQETVSRLHFNRDFQINSQPLAACMTPDPTMGGTAWPNFLCEDRRWEKALALWANTTLGLIAFWWVGSRQQQGRARLSISRLPELTVLDARTLSRKQLDLADSLFDEFAGRELLPANEAWHDETRQALDRAVLIEVLGLPEDILEALALLRRQWCAEPSVHGGKGTRPE